MMTTKSSSRRGKSDSIMGTTTDFIDRMAGGEYPALAIHPSAWDEIVRLGGTLRVHLEPLGCSGYFYSFPLDRPCEDDIVLRRGEARICIEQEAWPYVAGGKLDYRSKLKPPRFRILGVPHGMPRCPCNRSFNEEYPGYETEVCQAMTPMPWES